MEIWSALVVFKSAYNQIDLSGCVSAADVPSVCRCCHAQLTLQIVMLLFVETSTQKYVCILTELHAKVCS